MQDRPDFSEMPIGLGMAFAENIPAMRRFTAMSEAEQQSVLAKAHTIKSRVGMHEYVQSLVE